jgi:hypothetical protein
LKYLLPLAFRLGYLRIPPVFSKDVGNIIEQEIGYELPSL